MAKTIDTFQKGKFRFLSILLLIGITLFISACTTNGLILRFLYSRLDNNLYQRISAYADFDREQQKHIRQHVDAYFIWLRYTEMPRYAVFIEELQQNIISGKVDPAAVKNTLAQTITFFDHAYLQSPVMQSAPFLKNLSDEQVTQINQHFSFLNKKFREAVKKRQTIDSPNRRVDNTVKQIKRFGVTLNSEQKQILIDGFARYQGDPLQRLEAWAGWETTFIEILHHRQESEFGVKVTEHLGQYQQQLEKHYPAQQQHNRENSVKLVSDLLVSLDEDQKENLVKKLGEIRDTLLSLSDR